MDEAAIEEKYLLRLQDELLRAAKDIKGKVPTQLLEWRGRMFVLEGDDRARFSEVDLSPPERGGKKKAGGADEPRVAYLIPEEEPAASSVFHTTIPHEGSSGYTTGSNWGGPARTANLKRLRPMADEQGSSLELQPVKTAKVPEPKGWRVIGKMPEPGCELTESEWGNAKDFYALASLGYDPKDIGQVMDKKLDYKRFNEYQSQIQLSKHNRLVFRETRMKTGSTIRILEVGGHTK